MRSRKNRHRRNPSRSIETLDVSRYMGRWYEIAKYPNTFQKKCTGFTSAEYELGANGEVSVTNRCLLDNGETSEAIGAARQIGGANSPKLKVRFAPAWLSWMRGGLGRLTGSSTSTPITSWSPSASPGERTCGFSHAPRRCQPRFTRRCCSD